MLKHFSIVTYFEFFSHPYTGQLVSLYDCWSDQQDAGYLRAMPPTHPSIHCCYNYLRVQYFAILLLLSFQCFSSAAMKDFFKSVTMKYYDYALFTPVFFNYLKDTINCVIKI